MLAWMRLLSRSVRQRFRHRVCRVVDEFELIRRYFDRRGSQRGVVTGIGDDGAVVRPDTEFDQIQVVDTLVERVHFPIDTDPSDIAYRAVAVNLSDIAAMGGLPRWMTLALTLPEASERWVRDFARGLFAAADEFDVKLVGGDTTSGSSLVVTVAMTGEVERGGALLRAGARPDDTIYVTGTLGDAAAGLELLQRGERDAFLAERFLRPTARIEAGRSLIGKASAAIDISDGLVGDLKKLLRASGVGATVDIERLPISAALAERVSASEQHRLALTGGDDYELCFTANAVAVAETAGITAIGTVTAASELILRLDGDVVECDNSGYRHFK